MATNFVPAECFELTGPAQVTYDVSSGLLSYRGPTRPPLRDFVEVSEPASTLDTPIGRLVTATLRSVPDGDTDSVSVLLPMVNLAPCQERGARAAATFETVALYATSRSTIAGPGLIEGPVQLYEHVSMEGTARLGGPACSCRFSASLNLGLPGPEERSGLLRVEGECTFGTTGFEVALVRSEFQGEAGELLLELVVTPPDPGAIVGQALTTYPVAYEEAAAASIDTVTIRPDGPSIPVEIIT